MAMVSMLGTGQDKPTRQAGRYEGLHREGCGGSQFFGTLWSSGHAAEVYPAEPRVSNHKTPPNVIFQSFNLLKVLIAVNEGETPCNHWFCLLWTCFYGETGWSDEVSKSVKLNYAIENFTGCVSVCLVGIVVLYNFQPECGQSIRKGTSRWWVCPVFWTNKTSNRVRPFRKSSYRVTGSCWFTFISVYLDKCVSLRLKPHTLWYETVSESIRFVVLPFPQNTFKPSPSVSSPAAVWFGSSENAEEAFYTIFSRYSHTDAFMDTRKLDYIVILHQENSEKANYMYPDDS